MKLHRPSCVWLLMVLLVLTVLAPSLQAMPLDKAKPYVLSAVSGNPAHPDAVGLAEEVTVTVVNGGELIDEAVKNGKNIVLFMDRMPLKEVYPQSIFMDRDKGELRFYIGHSAAPIALWERFIASRKAGQFFNRKVAISVGIEDQMPIPTLVKDDKAFNLVLVRKAWFCGSIFLILVLLMLFLLLAAKSDILRDPGPGPATGRKPYSLALVQMATWFFVIITSWLMLYVVKHSFNTLSEPLVLLIGISAGTGIGGVFIKNNRSGSPQPSKGFLNDILSDDNGISFHRFQIFAWTVVLVTVFMRQVITYLTMPEFDSSLLVLMGISSGTYLGFKATEKPAGKIEEKAEEPA